MRSKFYIKPTCFIYLITFKILIMKNHLLLNVKMSLVSLFLMTATSLTFAQTITVENASFELPADGKHQNWTTVPGWSSDTEATDSGIETSGNATDGSYSAFILNSDPSVYNLANHLIETGEYITLTLDAFDIWNGPTLIVSLYYDNGDGTRNEIKQQSFSLLSGQNNALELTATATETANGSKLGIEISNESGDGGSGWTGFDNIILDVSIPNAIDPRKSDNGISVYPTSSTSSFNVVAPIGSSIKVFSISGILVSQITTETNTTSISVKDSGVYIINVGSESFKVLKQ